MMDATRKNRFRVLPVVLAGCLGLAGPAVTQAQGTQADSYTVGGYLGATDRNDVDLTYGAEFEYRPGGQWGYGAIVEHTPDVIRDRGATVLLGTANFRPDRHPRLKLTGGAGVAFTDYAGDNIRFRAGAGYDLIIEGPLTITPRVAFDFGEGSSSVVFGATANYRF